MRFFDDIDFPDNPRKSKVAIDPASIKYPSIINRPYEEFTDADLYMARERKATFVFDCEIYPNYFLVAFKDIETQKVVTFELTPDKPTFDMAELTKLWWVMNTFTLVSFNGIKFDMPVITMAIFQKPISEIKEVANRLILWNQRPKKGDADYNKNEGRSYRPKDVERDFNVTIPRVNHIDLIEVAPGQESLKVYNGRLGGKHMQDLPYPPDLELCPQQAVDVRHYCVNDLAATELLYRKLATEIELRAEMSKEYGLDLRSYSDAQIAEHVLVARCTDILGYKPKRPTIAVGTQFNYEPPAYMRFQTKEMQDVLNKIISEPFTINEKGQPESLYLKPQDDKGNAVKGGLTVKLGNMVYRLGIGGLHSTEKGVAHWASELVKLYDSDVASYYPAMILNNGYHPLHLGEAFLEVYRHIVESRLEAKGLSKHDDKEVARENKKIADSLKIVINGTFGKLGSKYSMLYSPHLLVQVTVTGQLSLLMLIEALELAGIEVVSANTDGIVVKPTNEQYELSRSIIKEWEATTNLEMEETQYRGILSRDVNNYIAIKKHYDKATGWQDEFPAGTPTDKQYKGKGAFAEFSLRKTPNCGICAKAIAEYVINGAPLKETITNSRDLTDFVLVKNVSGGAVKDNWFLGKAIRFYYSKDLPSAIYYVKNGNTVQSSQNGYPCMDLPDTFPTNIDYDHYANMSEDMLSALGYYGSVASDKVFNLFDEGARYA